MGQISTAMTDEKKTDRWARTLDKAGLLDPVSDSWEILESESGNADTIVVDTQPADSPPPIDEADSDADGPVEVSETERKTAAQSTDPSVPSEGGADSLYRQMHHRFDVGDYSGALKAAESLLESNPEAEDASILRLKARSTLMQMYESRIGSFKRIPSRIVSEEDIVWRNLDATTAFIAANVDGTMSFEDIIDISTVSRFDTCRILSQLLQEGIIK